MKTAEANTQALKLAKQKLSMGETVNESWLVGELNSMGASFEVARNAVHTVFQSFTPEGMAANALANGKSPEEVAAELQAHAEELVELVRRRRETQDQAGQ